MQAPAGPVEGAAARPADPAAARVWDLAATVVDPEVPVVTIEDLGILRSAAVAGDGGALVELTPTYSGCPAMGLLRDQVAAVLADAGYAPVEVRLVLSPAWTTDWMTQAGKDKLTEYGIAPPSGQAAVGHNRTSARLSLAVKCPRCHSLKTREMARFGSTACKAMYVCQDCLEPFDYFKVH
ncbi:MAG: phenylacetate-CoA oxygenase subunit PaaJ [Austwickia sp.]|jgi:ring-1,2-phenylacetyl-CoA epoxidase subunit PaaD|nr:MAG: phenylacetate-CoA oxygenase subunit PaaJ [Austwickia sp.]